MQMMNQMQMMHPANQGMTNNQFMGDIDPIMVNTLAPIDNSRGSFTGFEPTGLMNSSQMAKNLSGLSNLAQLGNNNPMNIANSYDMNGMNGFSNMAQLGQNNQNIMSETNMTGANNMMGMSNMTGANNMMGSNGLDNALGMMDNHLNANNIKNLSNLYTMNILKK